MTPNITEQLMEFADLCMTFHAKLRARGCGRVFAWLLTCEFLRTNLKLGAAIQLATEVQDPFLFPAVKK